MNACPGFAPQSCKCGTGGVCPSQAYRQQLENEVNSAVASVTSLSATVNAVVAARWISQTTFLQVVGVAERLAAVYAAGYYVSSVSSIAEECRSNSHMCVHELRDVYKWPAAFGGQ